MCATCCDGEKDKHIDRVTKNAHKAWRFVAEMHEISATFEAVGQPGGFHEGAADVYSRLESFKDNKTPAIDDVVKSLNQNSSSSTSTSNATTSQQLRSDLQTHQPI